jgi:hypothetical protein
MQSGAIAPRSIETSDLLATGYATAAEIWKLGTIEGQQPRLAMNFLLDRSADNWSKVLADLKAKTGECDTATPITATGQLAGRFSWTCAKGKVNGSVLLAPTATAQIQSLSFDFAP